MGVEAPKVETRVQENGLRRETTVEVLTPYGEVIASLTVSSRLEASAECAEHDVTFATRDDEDWRGKPSMTGGTSRVRVPLSTGEQAEAAAGRFP